MIAPFIMLYECDGRATIEADENDAIDAAVSRWVDSGRTRDTLLHLMTPYGDTYNVLASRITSWYITTAASREREREHMKAIKAEAPEWVEERD